MRKHYIIATVLSLAILFGCSTKREKINNLQQRLDNYYNSEELIIVESKPYTGILFQEYEDGYIKLEVGVKNGIPDGKFEFFEKKGLLVRKGTLKNGKENGLWESYYEDGNLAVKNNYLDGVKNGISEEYDLDGNLLLKGSYKNGKKDGVWEGYAKKRVARGTYEMDELIITWKVYDDSGNAIETDVYNPITGKIWMDRNLGASRVATSSVDVEAYGDLYQWGRRADGHQKRNSTIIYALSSTDTPSNNIFHLTLNSPNDWRDPQNNNLWQGVNGVNNPCPLGYRIPTETEWNAERQSWSSNNSAGAFASPLKLPMAGYRNSSDGLLSGLLSNVDSGLYWSSSVSGSGAQGLYFDSTSANMYRNRSYNRAAGFSVRCLMD